MNYLSIYTSIITNAQKSNRHKKKKNNKAYVYYESHHIIPKCIGGSDDISNTVLLTAREHFVCHQLLVKLYPGNHKLIFAMRMLTISTSRHVRNNKEYEWIRKAVSYASSESQKGKSYGYKFAKGHSHSIGEKNGMYGKTHSKETKFEISRKAKERDASTYEQVRLPKSDKHKENLRKSRQKCRYLLISPDNNTHIVDRIADAYILSGVSVSVLVKLAGNRYGFDNCRGWKISAIPNC